MLPALFLIIAATLFRILPPLMHLEQSWLQNFSPLAALVFCGALYFPRRMAIWVPLIILAVSDFILNHFAYDFPLLTWDILPRYAIFLAIGIFTFINRQHLVNNVPRTLGSSLAATILFYLVTNTAGWFAEPGYTKNLSGWIQALTVGLPGYQPTWTFFRNSLAGDFIFTCLFLVSMAVTKKKDVAVSAPVLAMH